MMNCRW